MRLTKLNHLLERRLATGRCPSGKQHYWVACGDVKAAGGNNIAVYVRCNMCNVRETIWLTTGEYELQQRVINNSIKEQGAM
tara:strand:+ start:174 stop:416 length:243 start_codon:yes stop_codon:yes gene_type:complete